MQGSGKWGGILSVCGFSPLSVVYFLLLIFITTTVSSSGVIAVWRKWLRWDDLHVRLLLENSQLFKKNLVAFQTLLFNMQRSINSFILKHLSIYSSFSESTRLLCFCIVDVGMCYTWCVCCFPYCLPVSNSLFSCAEVNHASVPHFPSLSQNTWFLIVFAVATLS